MAKNASQTPLIKNNVLVAVALLALLCFLIYSAATNKTPKTQSSSKSHTQHSSTYKATSYSPKELQNLLQTSEKDKYVVIDVRSKLEYDKGHVPGAVHADYYDTEGLKKAAGDKTPIVYCTFSAMRGPYAAYQLHQAGFTDVKFLAGGLSRWAEDIQGLDSSDPTVKTVFRHPKNIFPEREKSAYPEGQGEGEVEFKILASKYFFSPNRIEVKHGQKVTLHMMSTDVAHGFTLPEYGIEVELLPKEPETVTFIADRKGIFPFVCSVICGDAHDHASMVGNLIVK